MSYRDIEDLLAERGVIVSYESIRQWCLKFGPRYGRVLKRGEGRFGEDGYCGEVFISINAERLYLWRAVDQDGHGLDILVQPRRDRAAGERFFRKILKGQGTAPRRVVTDGLRSYARAIRNVPPMAQHDTAKYANNRAENSHQPTRRREREMQRFKSRYRAQRFLSLHARVNNLFRYGRHAMSAKNHRAFRSKAFAIWSQVTCA